MNRRRYSEYRPSGIEWLGEIPEHWEVRRVKNVATVNMGQSPSSEDCNQEGEGVPFLQGNADFGDIFPSPRHYCAVANKLAQIHDILFSVRAPVGAINVADQVYGIGRGLCAITPIGDNSQGYMLHGLEIIKKELFSVATGSTYEAVSVEQVGNARCLCPPPDEQRSIATFLDQETARIDALVAKKERQIELLQEKRTALISHVVTKGLNPNVKMKPSGIEWLGEIPEHWEVKAFKRLGEFQAGAGFPDEEQGLLEGELPFYKVSDTNLEGNKVSMVAHNNSISRETAIKLRAFIFPSETIIFAKVGAALLLNKRRILTRESCIDNNMMGFMRRGCELKWAYYWMCGLDLGKLANPGAVPSVNEGQVRDIPIPVPTIGEQRTIATFLDRETVRIDALIEKIRASIEKLHEYRTALISAAVTGKIDVREEVD